MIGLNPVDFIYFLIFLNEFRSHITKRRRRNRFFNIEVLSSFRYSIEIQAASILKIASGQIIIIVIMIIIIILMIIIKY